MIPTNNMIPIYSGWYLEPRFLIFFFFYAWAIAHAKRVEAKHLESEQKASIAKLNELEAGQTRNRMEIEKNTEFTKESVEYGKNAISLTEKILKKLDNL